MAVWNQDSEKRANETGVNLLKTFILFTSADSIYANN